MPLIILQWKNRLQKVPRIWQNSHKWCAEFARDTPAVFSVFLTDF